MSLPKDPVMLLSVVNTRLRDTYSSLSALCEAEDEDEEALKEALSKIDYYYDPDKRQFV